MCVCMPLQTDCQNKMVKTRISNCSNHSTVALLRTWTPWSCKISCMSHRCLSILSCYCWALTHSNFNLLQALLALFSPRIICFTVSFFLVRCSKADFWPASLHIEILQTKFSNESTNWGSLKPKQQQQQQTNKNEQLWPNTSERFHVLEARKTRDNALNSSST